MSASTSELGHAPEGEGITISPAAKPAQHGRIYTHLPKMWLGMSIASLCLLCQLAELGEGVVLLVSMVGSCYWLFCIHRIHKVLAEYTRSAYPISPRKAVGFQFIPLFEYYWFFRWTRQMASFVDSESGKVSMPKVWPGVLLTATSIFGFFGPFKSLRLFLIFGFGIFLMRRLRAILPSCTPLCLKRWQQFNLSMSAGVGAAFSFVLFQAIRHFSAEQRPEKLHELAAIFVVSAGVVIFLEPVFERLRAVLGVADNHPVMQSRKPWLLRLAVFAILVFTSFFHGLLHSEIEQAMQSDWSGTVAMLLMALLVSGGITYFWIGASHRHPSHAARSGLLSGTVLGLLVAFAVIAVGARASTAAAGEETVGQKVAHYAFPWAPSRIAGDLAKGDLGDDSGLGKIGVIALPWSVFGFIGGLTIDRRWGKGGAPTVALAISAAALIYGASLWSAGKLVSAGEMLSHLSAVIGWGLALIVCSSSRTLIPEEVADTGIHSLG